MTHKLSLRQYKRLLGIQGEEQLTALLAEFESLDQSAQLSEQAKTALKGMRQYLSQVDEAYTQADRDLALGKLSLELSSDELSLANQTLRHEAETRQQVLNTLRRTTNDVLSQLGKHLADEDSLEELSHVLAGLVTELLSTRGELQEALAAIKNQQFALDQHAIVSITDAAGNLIYANDQFCQISQYPRDELIGVNHRIVNSGLHNLAFFQNLWATISSGEVWHGEIRNRAKDQSVYWTNATIVPFLDAQKKPYQYISIRTDVTEQHILKEEIEASKSLLENVMNTLGEGVYTLDALGRCNFVNAEAQKILGWSLAQLTGRRLHDVIHAIDAEGKHVALADCKISNCINAGQVYRSEDEYFKDKSGRVFPVSIVASPIFENGNIVGSVAAFQDVTARHAADAALRQSETKQRMLLDNAADAVFVADKDERWIYVNDLALSMLGFRRDELIGCTIYDLLPLEYREISRMRFGDKLRREKLIRREIQLVTKNQGLVPVEMNVALLPDGSIYGSCRDITERKVFEAAMIRAKEGAESASKAKSEFLATMSHEIRTPMNGIIGMTELALDTQLSSEQREYLEMVKLSSHALLGIINDILDFSKIESGKLVLEKIEFPLAELIAATLKAMALRADQKGLELVYKIDPRLPKILQGDPGRVRQVITNLIANAIKFSDQGCITLVLRLAHQMGSLVEVYFSVSDTGIGIAEDKQATIFEPFSQADASTTRKYGGTGLGLSISARLVESMQGQLHVQSELGKGSTFYFTGVFGAGHEVEREDILIDDANDIDLRGLSVLVVDDNAVNRHFLSETLSHWQMHATAAASGAEALIEVRQAHAAANPFDVIILDAYMPDMDGFDVARQLQAEGKLSGAKLLMLSSAGSVDDAQRCSDAGIAGYLKKPISQQELQALIESALLGKPSAALHYTDLSQANIYTSKNQLRILLAEDNLINQKLVLALLKKWGHSTDVAENGKIAVQSFIQQAYDVILMDMQMPEMGGIEATQLIRQLENGSTHIPIIAMTANAMAGDQQRCLDAGMDHYLSKPIHAEKLRQLLLSYAGELAHATPIPEPAFNHKRRATDVAHVSSASFDYDAALLEGDRDVLQIIAPLFLEGCEKQVQELALAISQNDKILLHRSAHTMKGLVSNFVAIPIENLAKELELKGKNGDFERVEIIFSEMKEQLELMNIALRKFVASIK
ncbi:response regulator [Undibacterium sp. Ren11W]|uniref:response regulator n=1 Tax=Undibacterium sp. Ren11W TaxID=3413045 RepID=UPI003BEFFCD9